MIVNNSHQNCADACAQLLFKFQSPVTCRLKLIVDESEPDTWERWNWSKQHRHRKVSEIAPKHSHKHTRAHTSTHIGNRIRANNMQILFYFLARSHKSKDRQRHKLSNIYIYMYICTCIYIYDIFIYYAAAEIHLFILLENWLFAYELCVAETMSIYSNVL